MNIPIKPLERLEVSNDSLIDANRWRLAHTYHRTRQNVHFQSLSQPGIVSGLGVVPIEAPKPVSQAYRDGRWLEIQPGLAIDSQGNPIVVPEAMPIRIASSVIEDAPLEIYLTLAYVDPDELEGIAEQEFVTETFRIQERQTYPETEEIELCRIRLSKEKAALSAANNVFEPDSNEIDLRYRSYLKPQKHTALNVSVLSNLSNSQPSGAKLSKSKKEYVQASDDRLSQGLEALFNALEALYPTLNVRSLQFVDASHQGLQKDLTTGLIVLSAQRQSRLQDSVLDALCKAIEQGGTLLAEINIADTPLESLLSAHHQLTQLIDQITHCRTRSPLVLSPSLPANLPLTPNDCEHLHPTLVQEHAAVAAQIDPLITESIKPLQPLIKRLSYRLSRWQDLSIHHPLRSQPFRFEALPQEAIYNALAILQGPGLIIVLGSLTEQWQPISGAQFGTQRTREHIRTTQELGANLLHYASLRQQLTTLQSRSQ